MKFGRIGGRYVKGDEQRIHFKNSGGRPQNSPQRRLYALTTLLEKFDYDILELVYQAREIFSQSKKPSKDLLKLLEVEGIFEDFYNFTKPTNKKIKLLGKGRITDIVINILVPASFMITFPSEEKLKEKILAFLFNFPVGEENSSLKKAYDLFFLPKERAKKIIKTSLAQQGLLQLYKDYTQFKGDKELFWKKFNFYWKRKKI